MPYLTNRVDSGTTTYRVGDFIPQTWRGWDDYNARLARYEIFEGYYHNLAYHKIMQYAQQLKVTESLYKHVRGVHNPIRRLVEGYVSKVLGGVLDIETGTKGAIPLQSDDPKLIEAILQLWMDSQWGQKKSLYVRNGAMKGDSYIKIVDNIPSRQVRMEAVDPGKVKRVDHNSDGTIRYIEFEYYVRDYNESGNGVNRLVRETITEDTFTVETREPMYEGDKVVGMQMTPFKRFRNGRNELIHEWNNDYGFVPVQHVQHTDMGLNFGAPACHGILQKINELNDLASILNDGMRKQVQMPLVALNATIGALDFGSDNSTSTSNTSDNPQKDTMNVLNLTGGNADLKTLAPTINIADALQNIINIELEIERDAPELSLHRIREGGQLTAPGVRSAYDDAIARYAEARGNYDSGLVSAQKMAVAIGGMRGYDGYQGFNLMSLETGALEHQIAQRPVINDTLSLNEQMTLTMQALSANAPKSVYVKMGWSETEADELVESSQSTRNQSMLNNPFGQLTETPPPDDENETPEDAFDARQNTAFNESDVLEATELLATA